MTHQADAMQHLDPPATPLRSPAPPSSPVVPLPVAAVALMTAAVGLAVSGVTQPDLGSGAGGRLAAIASAGARADVSAVLFAVAQLPLLLGMLGLGALVRGGARRLAVTGTVLAVAGTFGHALFGGVSLTYLLMARESTGRPEYARLVADLESSPVMLVSVIGLAGTVLGLLLLSIALFRTMVAPRWTGPALWAFLAVEFVGTAISSYASYLSGVLLLLTCAALARTMLGERR